MWESLVVQKNTIPIGSGGELKGIFEVLMQDRTRPRWRKWPKQVETPYIQITWGGVVSQRNNRLTKWWDIQVI